MSRRHWPAFLFNRYLPQGTLSSKLREPFCRFGAAPSASAFQAYRRSSRARFAWHFWVSQTAPIAFGFAASRWVRAHRSQSRFDPLLFDASCCASRRLYSTPRCSCSAPPPCFAASRCSWCYSGRACSALASASRLAATTGGATSLGFWGLPGELSEFASISCLFHKFLAFYASFGSKWRVSPVLDRMVFPSWALRISSGLLQ